MTRQRPRAVPDDGIETEPSAEDWARARPPADPYAGIPPIGEVVSLRAGQDTPSVGERRVQVTRASGITPKRAKWLWHQRIPVGELTLLAGREGIGKSTVAYTLVADVTRGRMIGEYLGVPRNVAVAATEDSWEHTIVPRLMAAEADLDRVLRVEVVAADGHEGVLVLPRDIDATEQMFLAEDVSLLLLDPLMSRLSGTLDTHKDSEVRQGLEPLVEAAHRTATSILGIIHVNKATTKDILSTIMASRAFAAVARAVLFVMKDPDDERNRLFGLPKSNLGPTDLPTFSFTIEPVTVAETADGPIVSGRVMWGADRNEQIADVHESADGPRGDTTPASEVDAWLTGLMAAEGGAVKAAEVFKRATADGIAEATLKRARKRLGIVAERKGFGEGSWWSWSPDQPRSDHARTRGET